MQQVTPPVQDIKKRKRYVAIVNQERCKGCNECVDICPMGAIAVKGGKASVDAQNCVGCGACVNICPAGAISFHQ
ncbi:MAG: 4Fe-4S dicluster domain-containing protein [Thermodesulfobacteriota bacterium]|nr:4Fe-4S dicluster domain-containing protein [Thermodesulfobacteriota bacterium]